MLVVAQPETRRHADIQMIEDILADRSGDQRAGAVEEVVHQNPTRRHPNAATPFPRPGWVTNTHTHTHTPNSDTSARRLFVRKLRGERLGAGTKKRVFGLQLAEKFAKFSEKSAFLVVVVAVADVRPGPQGIRASQCGAGQPIRALAPRRRRADCGRARPSRLCRSGWQQSARLPV